MLEAAEYSTLEEGEMAISLTCVSPGGMRDLEEVTATGPLVVRPEELRVLMHLLGSSLKSQTFVNKYQIKKIELKIKENNMGKCQRVVESD